MKRHIAWLMACGVLAGCTSEPSPIDAPPAPTASNQANEHSAESAGDSGTPGGSETTPAAFHFKSGTLEIGDFDPYALGDDIFDPCTEISPEEFTAAGFDNVEPMPEEYAGLAKGLKLCHFSNNPQLPAEGFAQNNASRGEVEKQVTLLPGYESVLLPQIFVYGPVSDFGAHCYAQLDTVRGGLVSLASGWDEETSQDAICHAAVQNLEKLYRANAG